MILTDTHTHLYAHAFDKDRGEMIKRANQLGVYRFFMPNIDSESIPLMMQQAKNHPESCFPMMGLHPCSVKADWEKELALVEKWLSEFRFCAVGEIGMDLYWDNTHLDAQRTVFKQQLRWASKYNLPVAIHCREAFNEIYELLLGLREEEPETFSRFKGVFHCFSGTAQQAEMLIKLGFYLGIGGVLTYKNSGLEQALEQVSLSNILLETDAPYLAPVPWRGKRNECSYLRIIAEKLALLKHCSLKEVAEITTLNSKTLFGC